MTRQISKILTLVILISSFLLTSCKKEEDNPVDGGDTNIGLGSMTAKVDGQNWSATKIPGSPYDAAYAFYESNGSYLQITGREISGTTASTIQITMYNLTSTGDYQIGNANMSGFSGIAAIGYSDGKGYATTGQGDFKGTVKITKLDVANKNIAGTFSFNAQGISGGATGSKVVTEGVFNVKWTN